MTELSANKKQLIHRVAGVEGHVGSLKRMIQEDRQVPEILMQLSAIRSSLDRLASILFEEFVEARLADLEDEADRQAAIAEIRGAMQSVLRG